MSTPMISSCVAAILSRALISLPRSPILLRRTRNRVPAGILTLAGTIMLCVTPSISPAADFFVPSGATPTLQDALDDAGVSIDVDNTIHLSSSPIMGTYALGGEFNVDRRLTIRPADGIMRVSIVASTLNTPVFTLAGAASSDQGYITLQDLDILRTGSGSASHLVVIQGMSHVTVERCRIGLNWTTPGPIGFANLRISYPVEVVVRNCILFSLFTGNFDHAIYASNFPDPASSLYLYNNLAADYRLSGIRISDPAAPAGVLLVLRNNVAANHPAFAAEPDGYRSEIGPAPTVLTSHNAVFATPGFGETTAFGVSIAGVGGGTFVGYPRAAIVAAWVAEAWALAPPYDANGNFFRLEPGGPLHDAESDFGVTVTDVLPDAADIAVTNDIERQGRPGGAPNPHTDRGPDQIEPSFATAAPHGGTTAVLLSSRVGRNPARELSVHFETRAAGRLSFEVFDLAGRRLHRSDRHVSAQEAGDLAFIRVPGSGLVLYRLRLDAGARGVFEQQGKAVIVK